MRDPGGLEVLSDQTQSEEPQPSRQHAAEEIQVPVCLSLQRLIVVGVFKCVCVCQGSKETAAAAEGGGAIG